jgi:hypothetical protein
VRATRIIWEGAGSHAPHEGDGTPIPPRDPATLAPSCAMCGEGGPRWTSDDAFSDNFRPLSHLAQLYPHAMEGYPVSLCAACVWCSRALRLRCAPSFSRRDGVWFVPRRSLLAALLDPPEPPFVACAPLYGADHGGEAHGWRAVWPGEPALPAGLDVLTRLQSKHVAAYADIALDRMRYPLQWDDHTRVMIDVALWRDLAARLGAIAAALRGGGVGVTDTREALTKLRAPVRAPIAVHAKWPTLIRGLDAHARSAWWPLLADLVPLPDAPPRPEKGAAKTTPPKRAEAPSAPVVATHAPTPSPQPAAPPAPATPSPRVDARRPNQLTLF